MLGSVVISAAIALATLAVYAPVAEHDFVDLDDDDYVRDNRVVRRGLSWDGLRWAFVTGHAGNWHPLTWLSHMLDCSLFGLAAGAHHLVNVALHAANAILLFLVLQAMTSARWRSACVAALFALHPLHVESVAWIAERKDVLSTTFWLLTMALYVRGVREPGRATRAGLVAVYALGLMAKPMLVTLPFVLLLTDFWPLERVGRGGAAWRVRWWPLVREKLPLFALAAASSVITFQLQHAASAMRSLQQLPLGPRLVNAAWSYAVYLGKTLWPERLAVFYPYDRVLEVWQWSLVAALLGGVTALVLAAARRCPYLLVGWCWYVGTLVPVIGLVQVGAQARADRYTYIPLIGVFVAVAWGAAEIVSRIGADGPSSGAGNLGRGGLVWSAARRWSRMTLVVCALLVLAACALTSHGLLRHWRDSVTLFERALAVTSRNWLAHTNLGVALEDRARYAEAAHHYRLALEIEPRDARARFNLGALLLHRGDAAGALPALAEAARSQPTHVGALTNLALALVKLGRWEEAIEPARQAIAAAPRGHRLHGNLARILEHAGRSEEALTHYRAAIDLRPSYAAGHVSLADALLRAGRAAEAADRYREALRLRPGSSVAQNGLALALEALATSHAAAGRDPEARAAARSALGIARGLRNADLERRLDARWPDLAAP